MGRIDFEVGGFGQVHAKIKRSCTYLDTRSRNLGCHQNATCTFTALTPDNRLFGGFMGSLVAQFVRYSGCGICNSPTSVPSQNSKFSQFLL